MLAIVAMNFGTVIVLVLAALFFGGLILLAAHGSGSERAVKEATTSNVTPLVGRDRQRKDKRDLHRASGA